MKYILSLAILGLYISCNQGAKKETTPAAVPNKDTMAVGKPVADFKTMHFDHDKDFICGMPTSAGVSDTAQYKGKVYGFCSEDCKGEFVKDPEAYVTKK